MVSNTKQSTGPSEMVLDPFIVFNWLHRAAGQNCKKDVNQVAWKGYIEGLIARLESPYQLRHVLVPPSSIIHYPSSSYFKFAFYLTKNSKNCTNPPQIKSICLILAILLIVERIQTLLISNIQKFQEWCCIVSHKLIAYSSSLTDYVMMIVLWLMTKLTQSW